MQLIKPAVFEHIDSVKIAHTTRFDGASKIPYNSLNLAYHVGDNKTDVDINHMLLSIEMGYDYEKLVIMNQIHSDTIYKVDENHDFTTTPNADALITNLKQTPIMAMSADCTVVLLYDTKNHAIAAIHAGRKGAFLNIVQKTINAMKTHYDTRTDDIIASIGASIRMCCYEISSEIALEAKLLKYDYSTKDGKFYLDIASIIHHQLKDAKVNKIEINHDCTSCKNDIYYSYRADNKITGRNCGVIYLL